jgi:hypothetical protein
MATHEKMTPQQVKAKEIGIYNMVYSIALPVDTVFDAVNNLRDLAEHAGSVLTNQQMIDLAYVVLSKEPIFQQDICLWNRKPPTDKTWDNILEHFRTAQTDLSSLPSRSSPCQHCLEHG